MILLNLVFGFSGENRDCFFSTWYGRNLLSKDMKKIFTTIKTLLCWEGICSLVGGCYKTFVGLHCLFSSGDLKDDSVFPNLYKPQK